MKEKHTVTIENSIWELGKTHNVNFSELLTQAVKLSCGEMAEILREGFLTCVKCKKEIKLGEMNIIRTGCTENIDGVDVEAIIFMSFCVECFTDKVKSIDSTKGSVLSKENITLMLQELKNTPSISELVTVTQKGVTVALKEQFLSKVFKVSKEELEDIRANHPKNADISV